jgi:hypothetical protein
MKRPIIGPKAVCRHLRRKLQDFIGGVPRSLDPHHRTRAGIEDVFAIKITDYNAITDAGSAALRWRRACWILT